MNNSKNKSKMKSDNFIITKIDESHLSSIYNFESYEQELVDFLIEDSLDNQKRNISTTYLWFDKKTNKIAAYITILTDSINLTSEMKEDFNQKGIVYKSLPALKIGRLCVSDEFLRLGIGSLMIKFAFSQVIKINNIAGCRFVTLDAKANKDHKKHPLHFYKKMGFSVLRERQKGTTPMFKDIHPIIKAFEEEIKKK